jgi:hypothetical protein
MAEKPNERELALAARVNELSDADAAPTIASVGIFALVVDFLKRRVTRGVMAVALLVFIAYHGWAAFNDSQQSMADLQTKRAEAGQMEAEAAAINSNASGGSMQLETLLAQIGKTQAEADQAKADADAQTQLINGMPVAVAQEQANVAAAEAEAQQETAKVRQLVQYGLLGPAEMARRAMSATAPSIFRGQ